MMACSNARPLIQGYVDGELGLSESLELEQHVSSCAGCSQELKNLQVLSAGMKNPALYYPLPAGLKPGKAALKPVFWMRWSGAAAAAAVLAFELGSLYTARSNLAREVLTEHVRSLQAQHLMDVTSTDQHTVKPWFLGKIDFSPVVKDFKEQEFPLVGGRLDYLDGRPVAAIVYRRKAHIINLFTWPGSTAIGSESIQGFNLIRWHEAGMNYWVISDLNPPELEQFVELYRTGHASQ